VKSPVLFIGYEPSLHDEIREFLRERQGVAHFTDTAEDTIHIMDSGIIGTVVLKMSRLEDAAILRYINLNYQKTRVLIMPGEQLQEAIPALAAGRFELLHEPFRLEELRGLL
jgi:DNA-binding NtrC family response regulator